jgi:hypothetical protein
MLSDLTQQRFWLAGALVLVWSPLHTFADGIGRPP